MLAGLGCAGLDCAGLFAGRASAAGPFGGTGFREAVAALERGSRGRLGLAIFDSGTGARFAWRGRERFAMCSTFKYLLAAAVLAKVDAGSERLDRSIAVPAGAIVAHSPFSQTRVGKSATIAELCGSAIIDSDNAAANLLLDTVGGPAGLTRFLRSIGDPVTRLDRVEPALNVVLGNDFRDTTTPIAMLFQLQQLAFGRVLSGPSRQQLIGWMTATRTAAAKLRAQLPVGWRVASKTGAGGGGTSHTDNEVAILWPPSGRAPVLVASYITGSPLDFSTTNAIHARLGARIAAV
jgi:beta-lactamase class A